MKLSSQVATRGRYTIGVEARPLSWHIVFLAGCNSLQFSLYQRNPQAYTFDAVTTAVATNTKLVEVTWVCSRDILQADKVNTENAQSAKVAIRSR